DAPAGRDRLGLGADLDQEQLVVGAPGAEHREAAAGALDLVEAEHVPVEVPGPLQVAYVEDDVAELVHLHLVPSGRSCTARYSWPSDRDPPRRPVRSRVCTVPRRHRCACSRCTPIPTTRRRRARPRSLVTTPRGSAPFSSPAPPA